jgi:hypothetical protein
VSLDARRRWPDAAAFLADELASFRPFEVILSLSPDHLDHGPTAHGWSARDLLAHLVGWHEVAAEVGRELEGSRWSPRKAAADEEWARRGDTLNEEIRADWARLGIDEFRNRARLATEDLRAALQRAPVSHWWDNDEYFGYFLSEMQEHYDDHRADLSIVLDRSRAAGDAPS